MRIFPTCLPPGQKCIIYVMVVVSTVRARPAEFSGLSYVEWATPETVGSDHPYLPLHLMPRRRRRHRPLPGQHDVRAGAIVPPARPLWWSSFAAALFRVRFRSVFRRQWKRAADLPVPRCLHRPQTQVLASPLFWAAFALAAGVRTMVVAHLLAPSVPELPVNVRYYQLSPNLPWSAANPIPVSFFPFAIGLSFFLNADQLLGVGVLSADAAGEGGGGGGSGGFWHHGRLPVRERAGRGGGDRAGAGGSLLRARASAAGVSARDGQGRWTIRRSPCPTASRSGADRGLHTSSGS